MGIRLWGAPVQDLEIVATTAAIGIAAMIEIDAMTAIARTIAVMIAAMIARMIVGTIEKMIAVMIARTIAVTTGRTDRLRHHPVLLQRQRRSMAAEGVSEVVLEAIRA